MSVIPTTLHQGPTVYPTPHKTRTIKPQFFMVNKDFNNEILFKDEKRSTLVNVRTHSYEGTFMRRHIHVKTHSCENLFQTMIFIL